MAIIWHWLCCIYYRMANGIRWAFIDRMDAKVINAQKELIEHIGNRKVKLVRVALGHPSLDDSVRIEGVITDIIHKLNFTYDNSYGYQNLYGYIWYTDGSWTERAEYDGSEWWEYKKCPDLEVVIE